MAYDSPDEIINKNCNFHLGPLNFSLGEASGHVVKTVKQHCGDTMSGGVNFQHELARYMNELCLEVDPQSQLSLQMMLTPKCLSESSAEALDIMEQN